MMPTIERISAITFRVVNMTESLRFYRDVLGMELLYGGEGTGFSSLRTRDAQSAVLNLERGEAVTSWGRLIFYVSNVDALWNHLKDRGFERRSSSFSLSSALRSLQPSSAKRAQGRRPRLDGRRTRGNKKVRFQRIPLAVELGREGGRATAKKL